MNTKEYLSEFEEESKKTLDHLREEFGKIRTGRANASLVENILVVQYGTSMPLNQLASITIPDPKTISIQPWNNSAIKDIEKSIQESDLGITPSNNGDRILLSLPPMTEETRIEYVKLAKQKSESAKISIRNHREEALHKAKKEKDEFSKDDEREVKQELQEYVNKANSSIEKLLKQKEEEIMTL